MKRIFTSSVSQLFLFDLQGQTPVWTKQEIQFESYKTYDNPVCDVRELRIELTAKSGRKKVVRVFWDGGTDWKVRFLPDEIGTWKWDSLCSDKENKRLHNQRGTFECFQEKLLQKGAIQHESGKSCLSYNDGTPFLWLACNGALKSTGREWGHYLSQRKRNNYNTIQFVATEWRGGDKNAEGLTAIDGTGYLRVNPEFFKRIDKKIDEINEKGLLASSVVLWALPFGEWGHPSPSYALTLDGAVLLAKYTVAHYQGNYVMWTFGGDGQYYNDREQKWKEIGRHVFNDIHHAPVTFRPHESYWLGDIYNRENWFSLLSNQSLHNNKSCVIN